MSRDGRASEELADWLGDAQLKADFEQNSMSPTVGKVLIEQNDRVRIWFISLKPGERMKFHRHVLDYFWTAVSSGSAISHLQDGRTVSMDYDVGTTTYEKFQEGEYKVHDLVNIGASALEFVTVEFLNSANSPMDLPVEINESLLYPNN